MHKRFALLLIALAPACALDTLDGPDTGEEVAALTGTVNPVDCGFNDGRTCKSTAALGNNVSDTVQWDPCYGGNFSWTATASFEQGYDRACIGGKATAGAAGGCSAGVQLSGAGTFSGTGAGSIMLSLATDSSVSSNGFTSLTATCNEPQFIGVFRASSAGASQQVVLGQDWNTFITTWTTKSGQGMRLSKIETFYENDGTTRFDGVFTPGSGGYGLNAGMTIAQLKTQLTQNAANGMEIADLAALQTSGGSLAYVGVWRAGTRTQKIYDGLTSAFWSWSTPLTNQGYQPSAVESYFDGAGNQHYTAVMTLTPGQSGWEATVGVEYAELTHEWSKWRSQGFKLAQLETYIFNGVRYYDGFFVPGSGGDDFVPGARAQEFQAQLSRNTTAGLELVDLDRVKVARTAADPTLEDKLARGEYPVVSPVWMSQAENYFYSKQGVDGLGYTIALMKDGRLLGASSEGYAKSPIDGGGVRLDANAQWDYLSDSKWITSLAAAKVAEEQHIDLTTTLLVKVIAPQIGLVWQNTANPNDFWHITLKQSMTHTSYLWDGGCDNGPALSGWTMTPGPAMQRGDSGSYSYSGFDACFLRIWVEQRTGMTFERYVDTHLFRPNGIHDLDCVKDPEKSEVYEYNKPATPQDIFTIPGYSEPNNYCAADSFKGTPLQMLKILQMVRIPGKLLSAATLDQMRIGTTAPGDEWTFYQSAFDVDNNGTPDAYGYSMSGGRRDAATHIAQFPTNPFDSTAPFTTGAYSSGIDAVFFANEEPGGGFLVQWSSIQADPNP